MRLQGGYTEPRTAKGFASANLQTLLVFGGESGTRTPDLRIMIPSL